MKCCMRIIDASVIFCVANFICFPLFDNRNVVLFLFVLLFVWINIYPTFTNRWMTTWRLRVCADGCELLIVFLLSTIASTMYLIYDLQRTDWRGWLLHLLCVFIIEAVVFWNGIIRVYTTSYQLKLKWRVIGIVCGWIPIAQFIALYYIIRITYKESIFESKKMIINKERSKDKICETKYPILMVHGVFFRDFKYFNYWGRIPKELERNGAILYYGNHQSAAAIADSGKELADRIQAIRKETGSEKVNIIAHSKGGLDSRYAISQLGMAPYVASLTTINTPHKGCVFADYLLHKIPVKVKEQVADMYNATLKKMGDFNPDFLSSVNDLTASSCTNFNELVVDKENVYYQSVGSKLNRARDGRFPLNFSMQLVSYFDGPNDGLVAETSFPWGENFRFLTTKGNRGISHGDMIDLNRENIDDFDVREFYVELVHELKEKGF
ncbi:MAG: triacylglycerol lipase [Longicatena sp.]